MMSNISNFALTAPAPSSNFALTAGPAGGTAAVTLPEISVGPDRPDLGSGGALPGNGSYGDPIAGFHQINQQFADGQRAFSERMNAQSAQFNATMQAQGDARAVQLQAQTEANLASMNAQRAAMVAAPPVTGPILPPNFAESAYVPPVPVQPQSAPAIDPDAAHLEPAVLGSVAAFDGGQAAGPGSDGVFPAAMPVAGQTGFPGLVPATEPDSRLRPGNARAMGDRRCTVRHAGRSADDRLRRTAARPAGLADQRPDVGRRTGLCRGQARRVPRRRPRPPSRTRHFRRP